MKSGAFTYITGTHGKQHPRTVRREEITAYSPDQIVEVLGSAGTGILFDTSGVHRQNMPILERRHAIFYGYHDPAEPLQQEDVDYYRYHPLLLNAAFLGGLTKEDERILGFGDKRNYQENYLRQTEHKGFHSLMQRLFDGKLHINRFSARVAARLKRLFGMGKEKPPTMGMGMR